MTRKIILGLQVVIGIILIFIDRAYAGGWFLGWAIMYLVKWMRENLLVRLIDFKRFKVSHYVFYLLLVVVIIAIPLAIAFFYPEVINPYAVFLAYFIDRILMFVTGALVKE